MRDSRSNFPQTMHTMKKMNQTVMPWILGICVFLACCPTSVVAQDANPPGKAKSLPAGLRTMFGVVTTWNGSEGTASLCKEVGIEGHQSLLFAKYKDTLASSLEKGEIDAVMGLFWYGPHEKIKEEDVYRLAAEMGPKHNPKFRGVYVLTAYLIHDGRDDANKFSKTNDEYNQTNLAEMQIKLEALRKKEEAFADETNNKAGGRVVFLVPLGEGMLELRKMIVAGKVPGVTKQSGRVTDDPKAITSVLLGDNMPHLGHLGVCLGTYMQFAALYRMSPEGIPFRGKDGDGLTDEQRAILQKLAWDMVSKYPYAGIAK